MSKSLKNFIIIREMLKTVSPRILRLSYSLVNYDAILNYDADDDFSYARAIDKKFNNFFQTANYYMINKNENIKSNTQRLTEEEKKILSELKTLKEKVHEYLCDNFAVPKVITRFEEFVKLVNVYIQNNKEKCKYTILHSSVEYVQNILHCMGLEYGNSEGGNE